MLSELNKSLAGLGLNPEDSKYKGYSALCCVKGACTLYVYEDEVSSVLQCDICVNDIEKGGVRHHTNLGVEMLSIEVEYLLHVVLGEA